MSRFQVTFLHPRYWLTWLGLSIFRLLIMLPYPVLLIMGKCVGLLIYRVGGLRRRIARQNLELCFPELTVDKRTALLREILINHGIALFEIGMSWWWPKERFCRLIQLEGLENVEALNGQGALLMAMHFTTLEVGAKALAFSTSIDAMYRPNNNAVFDYIQRLGRERDVIAGGKVYPREDLRDIVRALRAGRIIWYAPDQDYGRKQAVFVPFFGVEAATVTATARLAKMGRAAVLPFTHERLADGSGYRVTVHPALENFPSGDDLQDAQHINGELEKHIRRVPEQYMWVHRRFKTRPEGEEKLYRKDKVKRKKRRRRH